MCLVCLSVFIAQAVPVNVVWAKQLLRPLGGNWTCRGKKDNERGKAHKHSVLKSPKYQKHRLPFTFIRHSLFIQECLPVIVLSATNCIKGLFVELRNPNQSSEAPCLFGIMESRLTGCGHTLFSDGTDANIMAAWFVLTNRSDICWPDKWSSSGYFSTLFHSLDPWPAVEVSRGAQWDHRHRHHHHHHVEGKSRARHPQGKKDIQRKRN